MLVVVCVCGVCVCGQLFRPLSLSVALSRSLALSLSRSLRRARSLSFCKCKNARRAHDRPNPQPPNLNPQILNTSREASRRTLLFLHTYPLLSLYYTCIPLSLYHTQGFILRQLPHTLFIGLAQLPHKLFTNNVAASWLRSLLAPLPLPEQMDV